MEHCAYSWDEAKNLSNQHKHGVSFEIARLVFDDPLHISRQDRIENGEQRWQTLGMADGVVLLLVAHTWHEATTGPGTHPNHLGATCQQAGKESL